MLKDNQEQERVTGDGDDLHRWFLAPDAQRYLYPTRKLIYFPLNPSHSKIIRARRGKDINDLPKHDNINTAQPRFLSASNHERYRL